jgi:hypothetical protein
MKRMPSPGRTCETYHYKVLEDKYAELYRLAANGNHQKSRKYKLLFSFNCCVIIRHDSGPAPNKVLIT